MKKPLTLCLIGIAMFQCAYGQTTYYTRTSGSFTDWDNGNRWTFDPAGGTPAAGSVPTRTDHVVILAGETVIIDDVTDNGSTGQTADGLGRTNVGAFTGSGTANFYQTGNITIEPGGILDVSVPLMLEGEALIEGTLTVSADFINLGNLEVYPGAIMNVTDDVILSGTSRTIVDNVTTVDDDLYLDHTEARLCGNGELNVGNNTGAAAISYNNLATDAQICSGMTVTCTSNCAGYFPLTGTGGFDFDLNQYNYAKTITIDNGEVVGDLLNFPVLVSYSDPSIATVADGGGMESGNGYDIIFATNSSCGSVTQLDHQIESYSSDGTNGTLIAWVRVPFVSGSSDTEILMYYGNSAATDDISVSSTFDTNYLAIWHLNESASGSAPQFNDVTTSGHTATVNGGLGTAMAGNITGQIGNGIEFDGDDYVVTTSNELQTENNFTVSAWFNAASITVSHILWEGLDTENGWGGVPGTSQEMHFSVGYCCTGGVTLESDRINFFLGDEEEENNLPSSADVLSVVSGSFTDVTDWHYVVGTVTIVVNLI